MKNRQLSFENEIIIVDASGMPQNMIGNKIASKEVIERIRKIKPEFIDRAGIDQELDACQIEIRNMGPKKSLAEAQDELVRLFNAVDSCLKNEYGLRISQDVAPPHDFDPVNSGKFKRYEKIHEALLSHSKVTRQSANIAGLHINIDTDFQGHLRLNNKVAEIFHRRTFDVLGMSEARYGRYAKVIEGVNAILDMGLNSDPKNYQDSEEMKSELLDEEGNPKFDYGLIRLKKFGDIYASELRTFDAGVSEDDLLDKTSEAYMLVQ